MLPVPQPLAAIARFGVSGVFLFFIISGFSLTMTMPKHIGTGRPAISYLCSRIFRIGPLFYALLLLTIPRDLYLYRQQLWPGNLALNGILLFNLVPGRQEGMVWVSWTISVEVIYYVFFPILYKLRPIEIAGVLFATAFLALVLQWLAVLPSPYMYFSFIGYVPLFLCGQLSFYVYQRLLTASNSRRLGLHLKVAGVVVLAACVAILPGDRELFMLQLRLAGGLGYSMILIGEGLRPSVLIVNAFNSFLGRISYSIYLCHFIVITLLAGTYAVVEQHFPPSATYVVCAAITLSITVAVSWAAYAVVEKPGITLGKTVLASLLPSAGTCGGPKLRPP